MFFKFNRKSERIDDFTPYAVIWSVNSSLPQSYVSGSAGHLRLGVNAAYFLF